MQKQKNIVAHQPLSSGSSERAQAWLPLQGNKAVGFGLHAASPALQALQVLVRGAWLPATTPVVLRKAPEPSLVASAFVL